MSVDIACGALVILNYSECMKIIALLDLNEIYIYLFVQESDLSKKMSGCNLDNFSEGLIGKLVVRKSGRVQLMLGTTYLDVNMGTPCGFLQVLDFILFYYTPPPKKKTQLILSNPNYFVLLKITKVIIRPSFITLYCILTMLCPFLLRESP